MAQILRRLISANPSKYNLVRRISCRSKPDPQYRTRIAEPRDYERIVGFMAETYMQSEPTIASIGLAGRICPTLIHLMDTNVREGMTIVVEELAGHCLVGAAVNIKSREAGHKKIGQLADCCECPQTRDLLEFYAFCSKQSDLWNVYCVDDVFECANVAVHPEHQGKGIAKRLVLDSWCLARDLAFRLFRIDCSSSHTARIAEQLSWKCIYSIPYRRYFSARHNDFPFKHIQEPHTEMKIFVDSLDYSAGYYPPSKSSRK